MKFGICIPTFGDSANRLDHCIRSVQEFTKGFEYEIFVRDGGTSNFEFTARQGYVASHYNAVYLRQLHWCPGALNLHKLGYHAIQAGCDIIVFLSDDCLCSKNWLYPIKYFYQWNESRRVGMVSVPFVEAWELTVAGILPNDESFYEWKNDGSVLREHLHLTEERFTELRKDKRISIDHFTPLGPMKEGRFNLTHAVPIDGGLGPCFTISAQAFQEVDGFSRCEYIGDYEALIGWKCWDADYVCVMIPGSPIYHARGIATRALYVQETLEHINPFRPWTEEATAKLNLDWHSDFATLQSKYSKLIWSHEEQIAKMRQISYLPPSFPINITYDSLPDINLGPIHWRDQRQRQRMTWIAEQCTGGGKILDVGCATGGLLHFLGMTNTNAIVFSYTGVDLDRVRIDEAKVEHPGGKFFVLDVTYGLPFETESFDTVVCADCLEHMPRSIAQSTIRELSRVCKSLIVLTLPIGDVTSVNVDHIWSPQLDSIPPFLLELGIDKDWSFQVSSVEDFALIRLERVNV